MPRNQTVKHYHKKRFLQIPYIFPSGTKKLYNEGRVIYEFSLLSWLTKKTSFFALEVSTRPYQDLEDPETDKAMLTWFLQGMILGSKITRKTANERTITGQFNKGLEARKNFEFSNNIMTVDPAADEIYRYNSQEQEQINHDKPWTREFYSSFYKSKDLSSGPYKNGKKNSYLFYKVQGNIEVMGLMQGKISGDTIIIMDAFALPVEGTETRVNAQAEAYEYMVQYLMTIKQVGRAENIVGWYHSHPGYGCWLSGIDVNTQMTNQQYQDPFVAVVIDPNRTISAGKVEIGAFRTYPQGYKAPDDGPSEYQTIPLSKIEDFGVHCKQYYQLEISHFKSTLDTYLLELLWNKYWVNTLSQSPLITNREYSAGQIYDLAEKLDQTETQIQQNGRVSGFPAAASSSSSSNSNNNTNNTSSATEKKKKEETPLGKITRDSTKITVEAAHGLISQVLKNVLFNQTYNNNDDDKGDEMEIPS
ncbi:7029_t:CDS:10 [Entrophospora sp. SA101]|nr:7029_t:CDS:10 [Entrophospora sp. SA101]